MRNQTQQAILDDIFTQAEFDRRLFQLRAANPHLSYELDEIARSFRRVRDRVAAAFLEDTPVPEPAPPGDVVDWDR